MITLAKKESILRNKPYLRVYFESSPSSLFELEAKEDSYPLAFHHIKGRRLALTSPQNPRRDILLVLDEKEGASRTDWKDSEMIVLLGLGAPGVLPEILKRLQKNQICIAIDAHLELASLLCQKSRAMASFLERPCCHLFCGPLLQETLHVYLDSLPVERLSGIRVLYHRPSIRLAPKHYRETENFIRDQIKARISDLLTRMEFEKLWIQNIMLNSQYLPPLASEGANSYTIKSYHEVLQGIPGVLVAAGPSLDQSLGDLRLLKERAFILCVDTALKTLLKNDIQPHAVITLDAQPQTLFAFLGVDLREIILFADLSSNPSVFRNSQLGKVIFSTTAKISSGFDGNSKRETTPGTELAESIHGTVGHLQSGGSVATSGFDLLRNMGCSPILLCGLDQSYTERKIHSNGTYHTEQRLIQVNRTKGLAGIIEKIIQKRYTFPTKSVEGGEVLNDYVLNLYHRWFEDSISRCQVKTFQINPQGAILEASIQASRPSERAKLIRSLPERKGLHKSLWEKAPQLCQFDHPLIHDCRKQIKLALQKKISIPELFLKYGFLRYTGRQAEIYNKRNRDSLSPLQAKAIGTKRVMESLQKLFLSTRSLSKEV